MTVFPKNLRKEFSHTKFILHCSEMTSSITPSYMRVSKHMWPGVLVTYDNIRDNERASCSADGSWTSGNVVSTA